MSDVYGLDFNEHCDVSGARLPGRGASMTLGEADAFRRGWRAAIEAAARMVGGHDFERVDMRPSEIDSLLAELDDAIRALPVPEGGR